MNDGKFLISREEFCYSIFTLSFRTFASFPNPSINWEFKELNKGTKFYKEAYKRLNSLKDDIKGYSSYPYVGDGKGIGKLDFLDWLSEIRNYFDTNVIYLYEKSSNDIISYDELAPEDYYKGDRLNAEILLYYVTKLFNTLVTSKYIDWDLFPQKEVIPYKRIMV